MSGHADLSREMPHAQAWDALPAAALGALDATARDRVLAHVAACPACVAELAALREAGAMLAHAAPVAAGDDAARRAAIRGRLLARAGAEAPRTGSGTVSAQAGDPGYSPALPVAASTPNATREPVRSAAASTGSVRDIASARPAPSRGLGMMAALAASLLLAAALGAWSLRAVAERDRVRAASIAVAARARNESVTLRAEIAERDRTLQALTGRDVRVVELTTAGARAPWARMFWDRGANHWMMFAGNLPKPAPGRTYELWLISDGRKIPAGTFTPNERGEAVMQARYALAPDKLQALAVTAEPEGGVDVPTGPVVISGAAASSR